MTIGEKLIREFYQLHPMPWEHDCDIHGNSRPPVHDANGALVSIREMILFISCVKREIDYKDWAKCFSGEDDSDGD